MFLIKPTFKRNLNMILLSAQALNMFARTEIVDNLNFYQNKFGIFGYMKLTTQRLFRLHSLTGTPLLWGPHNACGWDPANVLRMNVKELSPCRGTMNDEWCQDELLDSCFGHFLKWNGMSPMSLSDEGMTLWNEVVRVISVNAALGARLMLTVGKRYDPTVVTMRAGTSQKIADLFTRFMGTCKGWVELIREMALLPNYAHLNLSGIFNANEDFQGDKYIGDPIALFDALRASAPSELTALMNEGGLATGDGDNELYFGMTPSIHAKIADEYRKQCISVSCINPRLTVEKFPYRKSNIMVYYIDGVPCIPFADVAYMDRYLKEKLHMAWITVGGNINLGASFDAIAALDTEGNPGIGIAIQRSTDLAELGKYKFKADALFGTLLADASFFVGAQVTVTDDSVEEYAI